MGRRTSSSGTSSRNGSVSPTKDTSRLCLRSSLTRRTLFCMQLSIISTPSVASMKRDKKTKKLIRAGLPPSLRGRIWAFLLNCQVQRRQGLFDQLCVVAPATPEMEEAASKYVFHFSPPLYLPSLAN